MEGTKKLNILITSGPTRGYIDEVRYISNKSSGQLGTAIATEALKRGAYVTLVHGVGSITPDTACLEKDAINRLTLIEIETVQDLSRLIRENLKGKTFDAIIHAMAVLDYTPEQPVNGKLPSQSSEITIRFIKIPKIIKLIRELWPRSLLIGFKLEAGIPHEELLKRACASLIENKADFVVANDQQEILGGKHPAYIINSQHELMATCNTKQDIAERLIEIVFHSVPKNTI
ncbi:MAG: hypothetical protein E3K37_03965 [Candidatus Kuenenia sp.]|nr:hypothetical protein [Candidatus Kuenenia hertensis]